MGKRSGSFNNVTNSGANKATNITKSTVVDREYVITAYKVSIRGANASTDVNIQILDDTSTIWADVIGAGAQRGEYVGMVFPERDPLVITRSKPAKLNVTTGGTNVETILNLKGYVR